MKQVFAIFFLVFMFVVFLLVYKKQPELYQVLDVLEGDKFYVDFNKNNKPDKDELVHLKDVNTFSLYFGEKLKIDSDRFSLSTKEVLGLGYSAKIYTKKNLEGRYVKVEAQEYNPMYEYRFAIIKLNEQDYSKTLLNEGLAYVYEKASDTSYLDYFDPYKIRKNAKKSLNLNLVVLNKKSLKYHKIECEWAYKSKNYEIIPKKLIKKEYVSCKVCFSSKYKKKHENPYEEVLRIEKPICSVASGPYCLFFVEPLKYKRPSSYCRSAPCQALLREINSSKNTIDFALYGLGEQNEIYNALLRAKARGVKVRGVIDKSFDRNDDVYKNTHKLKSSFEAVENSSKTSLMHNKFFIFDEIKVLSGSMNISSSGSGGYNSNVIFLINDKNITRAYVNQFNQMYKGFFNKKKEYGGVDLNNVSIRFSPDKTIYSDLISQKIKGAKKTILISAFFLTHKDFTDLLIEAKGRGVQVKIIMDAVGARNKYSKLKVLREQKIPVKVENWGGKNHQKVIQIDDTYLLLGSMNFTNAGFYKNDENVILIKNPTLALAYKKYFYKLYNSIPDKYLNWTPRPEGPESKGSCYDGIDNNYDGLIDSKDPACKFH